MCNIHINRASPLPCESTSKSQHTFWVAIWGRSMCSYATRRSAAPKWLAIFMFFDENSQKVISIVIVCSQLSSEPTIENFSLHVFMCHAQIGCSEVATKYLMKILKKVISIVIVCSQSSSELTLENFSVHVFMCHAQIGCRWLIADRKKKRIFEKISAVHSLLKFIDTTTL